MELTSGLTKENFFNEMYETYPKACKLFCDWIDKYKEAVKWDSLFAPNNSTMQLQSSTYKFHDIPYAMQQGIWIEFVQQTLNEYFEQPEYEYSMDLEEDIKTVFGELEQVIDL